MISVISLAAPAKLNLKLHICGRRDDGMHLLDSLMLLIDMADTIVLQRRGDGKITRSWQHEQISETEDIALAAARRLAELSQLPAAGVNIHIKKKIPVGSGLGGGSSNAAAVLIGLNRLWQLNLSRQRLAEIAAPLGADVPFFIYGTPGVVSGIGDRYQRVDLTPEAVYLLVFPPLAALTKAVYQEYRRLQDTDNGGQPLPFFLQASDNDLTAAALNLYPQIAESARALYNSAGEARLSGSGATLYAVFPSRKQAAKAQKKLPPATQSLLAEPLIQYPAE